MKGSSEDSIESIRASNLQAFANMSTLHGMSHIFAYGHMTFRRFLWSLSFLGSLALLMIVCMDRVIYYLEYPHVTKLDEVAAPNLTFPAVTFCNLNEFRFSKITRNDLYHVGELLALLNNNYQIANPHLADPEVLASLKDKANFQNFKPKLFNMTDFYNRTGHDIKEMLLQCTFRGEECYPANFTTFYITSVKKKARQRLYYLRCLRDLKLCTTESILTGSFIVWMGGYTQESGPLSREIQDGLPRLEDIHIHRCQRRAQKIVQDKSHPYHGLFTLLPFGRRYCLLKTITERMRKSFLPEAIRLLNQT